MVDSEEHSSEDSEWQGTASLGTEVLEVGGGLASLCCRRLPLRAVPLGPPGGLLGGCEGTVGLPGDWPGDGSWLEVVLRPCPFPESLGPCRELPGAEEENPERGWIWVFLSSWEPLPEAEMAWPGDAELGMVRECDSAEAVD